MAFPKRQFTGVLCLIRNKFKISTADVIQNFEQDVACDRCEKVIDSPISNSKCHHGYCCSCISWSLQNNGPSCPRCFVDISTEDLFCDDSRVLSVESVHCVKCGELVSFADAPGHFAACLDPEPMVMDAPQDFYRGERIVNKQLASQLLFNLVDDVSNSQFNNAGPGDCPLAILWNDITRALWRMLRRFNECLGYIADKEERIAQARVMIWTAGKRLRKVISRMIGMLFTLRFRKTDVPGIVTISGTFEEKKNRHARK